MVVVFNPAEFRNVYPQFNNFSDIQLDFFFKGACQLLDNTDNSPVQDGDERKLLLFYLVCHLVTLAKRGDDMVGTISSVNEGSVSMGLQSINGSPNGAWYQQTRCGAMYWQATTRYRLGIRYTIDD